MLVPLPLPLLDGLLAILPLFALLMIAVAVELSLATPEPLFAFPPLFVRPRD